MACFIVPTAEAIVTTVAKKRIDKKQKDITNPFVKRLNWLNTMLWGGGALLAFEHVWHGEVTFTFPFLTNGLGALHEMATVGTAMAAVITIVWAGTVLTAEEIQKHTSQIMMPGNN